MSKLAMIDKMFPRRMMIVLCVLVCTVLCREWDSPGTNASVLFIVRDYNGAGRMRGLDPARYWPGDARVILCDDAPNVARGYDVIVHVKFPCEMAFHALHTKDAAHVWDVIDNYDDASAWRISWDAAIVGTQLAAHDMCTDKPYSCMVVQHLPNVACDIHGRRRRHGSMLTVGVVGTGGRSSYILLDALRAMPHVNVIEEIDTCFHGRAVSWPLALFAGAPTASCMAGSPCDAFWDLIDIAVVWTKSDSTPHKEDYKPCTRVATALALDIPTVVSADFQCIRELEWPYEDTITAMDEEEAVELVELYRYGALPREYREVSEWVKTNFEYENIIAEYSLVFDAALAVASLRTSQIDRRIMHTSRIASGRIVPRAHMYQ